MKQAPRLLFLSLFALMLHSAGAWILPLMDRDEPRFAEAAREMRESGDWVVPRFNNEPRLAKPPLIYWCQAASYRLLGETDFAARFPSILAATLTALLIFGFGCRIYDEKTGFWAAIAFTLCLHVLLLAKAATADMLMVFFVTAAAWAGWELMNPAANRKIRSWGWVFYVTLALGFLAKGPVAFIPLIAVLLYGVIVRPPRYNGGLSMAGGITLILLLVGLWGIPALLQTNGDFFRVGVGRHVVHRSFGVMEGHGGRGLLAYLATLPFYFVTVFVSFFPWSLFLPSLLLYLRKKENRRPEEIYLLTGILLTFLIFTFIRTKLPHYTLPAFPLLALLSAGIYFKTGRPRRPLLFSAAGMTALSLALFLAAFPIASRLIPAPQLLRRGAPWLKPEMEFASSGYDEPSLVWYFRSAVRGFHHPGLRPQEIADFMRRPGPRFAVLTEKAFGEIASEIDPAWKIITAGGIDPAKGRWVDLKLLVKIS